jgi:hypothetical protein
MFRFEPSALARATRDLAERHIFRESALDDPDRIDPASLGALVAKVLGVRGGDIGGFVANLTVFERKLLPSLCIHQNPVVRERVLEATSTDPTLASARYLWRCLCSFPTHATSQLASRLALGFLAPEYLPVQQDMLRARIDPGQSPEQIFWGAVVADSVDPEVLLSSLDIPADSMLNEDIQRHLLTQGDLFAWMAESAERLVAAFERFPPTVRVRALSRGHANFEPVAQRSSVKSVSQLAQVGALADAIRDRKELMSGLESVDVNAYRWWRTVLLATALSSFFSQGHDNERFEFWADFLPWMQDVNGDLENGRLFIDFGGFGVIEFADQNNAAYVYEPDVFNELMALGLAGTARSNNDFKDRTRVFKRITHRRGWQGRARQRLRQWFVTFDVRR